jgi:hypothetical protein
MQGLDIETANAETGRGELDPEKGRVRLVQIRDGKRGRVYDGHDPRVPDALRARSAGSAQRHVRARLAS